MYTGRSGLDTSRSSLDSTRSGHDDARQRREQRSREWRHFLECEEQREQAKREQAEQLRRAKADKTKHRRKTEALLASAKDRKLQREQQRQQRAEQTFATWARKANYVPQNLCGSETYLRCLDPLPQALDGVGGGGSSPATLLSTTAPSSLQRASARKLVCWEPATATWELRPGVKQAAPQTEHWPEPPAPGYHDLGGLLGGQGCGFRMRREQDRATQARLAEKHMDSSCRLYLPLNAVRLEGGALPDVYEPPAHHHPAHRHDQSQAHRHNHGRHRPRRRDAGEGGGGATARSGGGDSFGDASELSSLASSPRSSHTSPTTTGHQPARWKAPVPVFPRPLPLPTTVDGMNALVDARASRATGRVSRARRRRRQQDVVEVSQLPAGSLVPPADEQEVTPREAERRAMERRFERAQRRAQRLAEARRKLEERRKRPKDRAARINLKGMVFGKVKTAAEEAVDDASTDASSSSEDESGGRGGAGGGGRDQAPPNPTLASARAVGARHHQARPRPSPVSRLVAR